VSISRPRLKAKRTSPVRLLRLSPIALALACALSPGAAAATSTGAADSALSPRLAELARPAVRSAPRAEQAARLSLAADGPGSLLRDGRRVLADVRFESGAAAGVEALRATGAEIVSVSGRYQTVTVAARPAELPAVAAVEGVASVNEVLTPIVRGADCGGAVRSEGDSQLNAANARASFGIDGSGVTVGILSDSFDRAAGAATHAGGDVGSGDLPGAGSPCGSPSPVNVLDDSDPEGDDEGRGMAQIVHDLAPGAALDFATAFGGELDFAANIRALAGAGAQVIADDVTYFEEPFFQDGPVAVAIGEAVAAGVSYFSAAGNDNLVDKKGHDIASWEAPQFRDSACPAPLTLAAEAEDCMDFDPGPGVDPTFGLTVAKGATLTVDLQWAEPWNGVAADLDSFLLDQAGNPVKVTEGSQEFLVGAGDDNLKSQRPVEVFQWENETGASAKVQLAINRCFGVCNPAASPAALPRLKFALLENGSGVTETEYPQSALGDVVGPTVYGHAGSAAAIAVGAVGYDNGSQPERYSSRGPVTHYFGPASGASPAPPTGAQVLGKPDVAATDCGATTFFGRLEAGVWRFCGTSAAAPHAAAVAALMRQANPGAAAGQVRAGLLATALPVGGFGPTAVGAGLLDAFGAVAFLALPPTITITQAPQSLSRERRPTVQFTANRPVAFSCSVDGGPAQSCASPFGLPALGDGRHGFAVSGVDAAGRTGTSPVATFTIDTRAPRTSFAKHPRKLIRSHRRKARAVFRFRSSEPDSSFVCKIDRGLLRFCRPRIVRRFEPGRHTVQVKARDAAGNVDRSPAVFHFRVKRVG
jgi:hypothetical protein